MSRSGLWRTGRMMYVRKGIHRAHSNYRKIIKKLKKKQESTNKRQVHENVPLKSSITKLERNMVKENDSKPFAAAVQPAGCERRW